MRTILTNTVIASVFLGLIISLSADEEAWYKRIGRSLNLLDLTSSTSELATSLNSLIDQKNPFTAFDIFLNQTRRIIPTIATFGNFTLLQAALVCATGAIAAGAATIAAEAFYFKTKNDQDMQMQHGGHEHHYQTHYEAQLPNIVYGKPNAHRRTYDEQYGTGQQANRNYEALRKANPYLDLQRRYPTKSLKRTQRRNQRKNKNSADQLDNLFPSF